LNKKLKSDFTFASVAIAVSMVLFGSAYAQGEHVDSSIKDAKTSPQNPATTEDSLSSTREQQSTENTEKNSKSSSEDVASKYNYGFENKKKQSPTSFDDSNSAVRTTILKGKDVRRDKQVENVTTKIMETMSYPVTLDYLDNQHFADSATFPSRLIQKINNMPSTAAPRSPISGNAVSCFYGVPPYKTPEKFDVNTTPIRVTADSVSGKTDTDDKKQLVYEGKVHITQGDKTIDSDKATYSERDKTLTAEGNAVLSSGDTTARSQDPVIYSMETKKTNLTNAVYQMNGSVLNGEAKAVEHDGKKKSRTYTKATISGCPADRRLWHLYSSEVSMQEGDYFGSAWNDVLFIGKVPVFYLPYINFPITHQRRTGLLRPGLVYKGGSGFGFEQPLYLNIAPNYDATVTFGKDPSHGRRYDLLFRFMPFKNFSGEIKGTYLPDDPKFTRTFSTSSGTYSTDTESSDRKRWFLGINSNLTFLNNDLVFKLNYSKVREGDYTYLTDISQKNVAVTDSSLVQSLSASYRRDKYDTSIELRKYQNMYSTTNYSTYKPFALLPQIKFNAYDAFGKFRVNFKAEATRFVIEKYRSDNSSVNMTRLHLEPSIKYTAYDAYGVTADFGLTGFFTHYNQSDLKDLSSAYLSRLNVSRIETSKNRALYLFEGRLRSVFERKVLDMNHTQTLEPEIKYMYLPYKDQSMIPLYDTTYRYDDYYTIFSPRRYAGIDRIANLNTLAVGLTSRLLDSHDREIIRFSIAKAINFEKNKVGMNINGVPSSLITTSYRSPIEATFDAAFGNYYYRAQAQYNSEIEKISVFNTGINYANHNGLRFGLSYRFYRNGNYLRDNSSKTTNLSQLGITASIPLNHNWKIYGAAYRDIKQNYNIDSKIGIKYDNCCYSVAFIYENYTKYDYATRQHENDRLFGLYVEFKGMYEIIPTNITDPHGTSTHYLPDLVPNNLNR